MHNASSPLAIDGDQHQSIGQYWRYTIHGAMPAGALITDYAFAYHSPPLWWVVMATLSSILNPILSAKIMQVVAYALTALGAALVVGRRTDFFLGIGAAVLALRSPDMPEQITGGMARSMGPAFLYLFLFAFMERRHKLVLFSLLCEAATYPSVVIPCGITYGVYCLIAGPMKERLRRCAMLAVAGVLIIGLGEAQEFKSPKWWGPIVTFAEASTMRAWHPGGRFEEVPHKPAGIMIDRNFVRAYKRLGASLVPQKAQHFIDAHITAEFLVGPVLIGFVLLCWGRLRRPRFGPIDDDEPRFPWETIGLIIGSLVGYALVRAVSFKLFLPARQLAFTLQYIVTVAVPIIVFYGAWALWPRRRYLASAVAFALTILPAFALVGEGLGFARMGYNDHAADKKIYEAVRKLPLDEQVACDIYYCELMMVLGRHAPYAAKNLTHPLRKGYYEEAERRLVEMQRVLFATDVKTIQDFVAQEHVKYFVYNTASTTKLDARLYQPVRDKVNRFYAPSAKKKHLLEKPPQDAVIFRDGPRVLVDLTKITAEPDDDVDETDAPEGPAPAPFIGPMLQKCPLFHRDVDKAR
jgi:hypothetical protein